MKKTVNNPKLLGKSNKAVILKTLYSLGPMSRKALAEECKLTKAGVSMIIKNMLEDQTVLEKGKAESTGRGQKETLIDINYEKFLAASVNIESDKLHFALCRLDNIKKKLVCDTSILYSGSPIARIRKRINEVIKGYEDKILGLGIGVAGYVDERAGIVKTSYGLFKENFELKKELEKFYDFKIVVTNNVKAQAMALIDDDNTDFLYIKHSPGLGCSVVENSIVLDGVNQTAGELGHIIIEPEGELCRCGKKGCLEAYIAENRIINHYYQNKYEVLDIKEIYDLYQKDKVVTCKLNDCIQKLSLAVSNASALIDPKKIVVMGGIFNNENLYRKFKSELKKLYTDKKVARVDNDEKIKSIAGGRLILKRHLFEVR